MHLGQNSLILLEGGKRRRNFADEFKIQRHKADLIQLSSLTS